jgi:hypothetical protein
MQIDKVGDAPPADVRRVSLVPPAGAAAPAFFKAGDARRSFPPAQFQKMSDAQKLSAPAFQAAVSGVQLGVKGAALLTGRAVRRSVRYEETVIDTMYRRLTARFVSFGALLFTHLTRGAAITKNNRSHTRRTEVKAHTDQIRVVDDGYVVAYTSDNRAVQSAFETEHAAREWMQAAIDADPHLTDQLHVIPTFETSAAA